MVFAVKPFSYWISRTDEKLMPRATIKTGETHMTKPNDKLLETYRKMAKDSSRDMEKCIRRHLEENCPKFKGNEERFEDCIKYVEDCAREILGSRHCGDVADDACYRMARDYFDDELWKEEEEAKAKHAAEAAEAKKKEADRKVKLARRTAAKEKKAEALARKKAEEERKAAELKIMQEEAAREAKAAEEQKKAEEARKADLCPGQMDFFALMGC